MLRFAKSDNHLLRFARAYIKGYGTVYGKRDDDHLLRFARSSKGSTQIQDDDTKKLKRFNNDDHMLRFARSPDEHLLRFARLQNDNHLLRFARSNNDDHMLRFARESPYMPRYLRDPDNYMLRFSRDPESHMLRFSKRSNDRSDELSINSGVVRFLQGIQNNIPQNNRHARSEDNHLLRFAKRSVAD
jgi:hypothetical protein